jgi:transposase
MYAKIRRMHFREGLTISEIQRRTSLSRNTIKKWLREPEGTEPKYQRSESPSKIAPYVDWLIRAVELDQRRPPRERRTALRLFHEIKKAGFTGTYCRVSEFLRRYRAAAGNKPSGTAFVPLRFELGEAFQFDWSEERLVVGGLYRKILAAHLKLCASRAFWIGAYPTQSHEMLFDAHTRAFKALGGVPLRGIYDNMRTAVDKVRQGKLRVVNARFAALCAHYLFDPDFCNVASGWEKGVVEKNVQDARRRIWIDAAQQRFSTFADLNVWLEARCRALWQETRHPDYPDLTLAEMLEHEQPHLMPMPSPFDGYVEVLARVTSTCLVNVQRNRYSVPCELAGQIVSVRLYPEWVTVYTDQIEVARHTRLFDREQISYDWMHYVSLIERKPGALRNGAPFKDMPAPLRQLQEALLRHVGGDRVMAKVLGAVPKFGLNAVLVAVDLVLESGNYSAEHVINVLARLHQAERPQQVETGLRVQEEPKADTARYDSLRGMEVRHV